MDEAIGLRLLLQHTMRFFGDEFKASLAAQNGVVPNWPQQAETMIAATYEKCKREMPMHMAAPSSNTPYYICTCILQAILIDKPLRISSREPTLFFIEKYINPLLAVKTACAILKLFRQSNGPEGKLRPALFPIGPHAPLLEKAIPQLHRAALGHRVAIAPNDLINWLIILEKDYALPALPLSFYQNMGSEQTVREVLVALLTGFHMQQAPGPHDLA